MNEYLKFILDSLDISYIGSVMLIGYIITKSSINIKLKKRWIILIIGVLVAILYYFVLKVNLGVLFFSFITAQFLNLYIVEYIVDFIINKIKQLTNHASNK